MRCLQRIGKFSAEDSGLYSIRSYEPLPKAGSAILNTPSHSSQFTDHWYLDSMAAVPELAEASVSVNTSPYMGLLLPLVLPSL